MLKPPSLTLSTVSCCSGDGVPADTGRSSTVSSPQGTGGFFSIDSEEYEAMPVEVKLLPRKLRFFCDPRRRAEMLQSSAE